MSSSKSDINNTYVSEMIKYQALVALGTERSEDSGTWVSTSSSISYPYTDETDLMDQLKTTLLIYMITASDWNSVLDGSAIYATTTGTANTYVVSPSLGLISYNDGLTLRLKFNVSNTSSSTINVDSLGVKNIKKITISGKVDISTTDIITDCIHVLVYDGTDFILINPSPIKDLGRYQSTFGLEDSVSTNTSIDTLGSVTLTSGETTGTVVKTYTVSLYSEKWGNVKWGQTVPNNTSITCDILDTDDNVLKSNVISVADISDLAISTYSSIKVKWTLTRDTTGTQSPSIYNTSVTWEGSINASATYIYDTLGVYTFTAPVTGNYNVVVVGGGGGGGGGNSYQSGGGGGRGDVQRNIVALTAQTEYTVTVGDGGAAGSFVSGSGYDNGTAGSVSSFSTLVTANGGGGGGGGGGGAGNANGGSGGGGGGNGSSIASAGGSAGQYGAGGGVTSSDVGSAGSAGYNSTTIMSSTTIGYGTGTGGTSGGSNCGGGGGGGYGGVGQNATNTYGAGAGGYGDIDNLGADSNRGSGYGAGGRASYKGTKGIVIVYFNTTDGGTFT